MIQNRSRGMGISWRIFAAFFLISMDQTLFALSSEELCVQYPLKYSSQAVPLPSSARPAHSPQGVAFDESPTERGVLWAPLRGVVQFPSSCRADAEAFLEQGVALLHGFFWIEAERSFREALFQDPDCAIAYWGMAEAANGDIFTHDLFPRAQAFIAKAWEKIQDRPAVVGSRADARERRYIESLAHVLLPKLSAELGIPASALRRTEYLRQLEALVRDFPEDREAKTFLVFAYLKNADVLGTSWDSNGPDSRKLLQAAHPLIEEVLDENPRHPIHHHKIHLWNYRSDALALESAEANGPSAPSVPHMWHMPSHIYFRLGTGDPTNYRKAAYYQEAALRTYHRYLRDSLTPAWAVGDYAHNANWLLETLNRTGDVDKALAIAENLIDQPARARGPQVDAAHTLRALGKSRLIDLLENHALWDRAQQYLASARLEIGETADQELRRLRLMSRTGWERRQAAILETSHESLSCLERFVDKVNRENFVLAKKEEELYRALFAGKRTEAKRLLRQMETSLPAKPAYYEPGRDLSPTALAAFWKEAGEPQRAEAWTRAAREEGPGEAAFFPSLAGRAKDQGRWEQEHPPLSQFGPLLWTPPPAPSLTGVPVPQDKPLLLLFSQGVKCRRCDRQLQQLETDRALFSEFSVVVISSEKDEEGKPRASWFTVLSDPELTLFQRFGVVDRFERPEWPRHGVFLIERGKMLFRETSAEAFLDWKDRVPELRRLREAWRRSR